MTKEPHTPEDHPAVTPPALPGEGRTGAGADTAFLEMLRKRRMTVNRDANSDAAEVPPSGK